MTRRRSMPNSRRTSRIRNPRPHRNCRGTAGRQRRQEKQRREPVGIKSRPIAASQRTRTGNRRDESGERCFAARAARREIPEGPARISASRQDTNSDNSSLLSKVKDAMQNLLSRMKPQPSQSGGQQPSTEQSSKHRQGQQSGSKQQSAKNGQQQPAGSQAGAGRATGEQAQNSQDRRAKARARATPSRPANSPAAAWAARTAIRASGRPSSLPPWEKSARSSASGSQYHRRDDRGGAEHQPGAAHALRAARRAALAGRRRYQPRRNPGGAARLRGAVLRTGAPAAAGRGQEVRVSSQTRFGTPRSRSFTRS